ncbi:MAG: hypothetical protein JW976_06080 [Syntrophaceae bacterium]|nr:hypothetical protein [Syntrophaceae bacterium]
MISVSGAELAPWQYHIWPSTLFIGSAGWGCVELIIYPRVFQKKYDKNHVDV